MYKENKIPAIIGGVLIAVYAVFGFYLIDFIKDLSDGILIIRNFWQSYAPWMFVNILGLLVLAIGLIIRKKPVILSGVIVCLIPKIWDVVTDIKDKMYNSNSGYFFGDIFDLAVFVFLLIMVICCIKYIENKSLLIGGILFAAVRIITSIIGYIGYQKAMDSYYHRDIGAITYFSFASHYIIRNNILSMVIYPLIFSIGLILAAIYLYSPEISAPIPKKSSGSGGGSCSSGNYNGSSSYGYKSLGTHVVLLLFTLGIYMYIWIYRATAVTNDDNSEEYRDPTKKLLICLFVPFYQIFWTYKTAQRADRMCQSKGISCELTTICLVLAIFVPIIPPILLQDKINAFLTAPEKSAVQSAPVYAQQTFEPQPASAAAPAPAPQTTAQELIDLKNLLDSGIVTQEEFEAKKKQLLGL